MDAFALVSHTSADQVLAWRHGVPITVGQFLVDVERLAAAFPAGRHVLNACADRYRFAVGLAAALTSGRISLLPPSHTPETVRQMKAFAADAFCLADGPSTIDLPRLDFDDRSFPLAPVGDAAQAAGRQIPQIPADRAMAFVFTSGSTGVPVPHLKRWGQMVRDVRAERAALLAPPQAMLHVLGTVPPQHMYGIESTVLLPLQSGGTLSSAHPFYPADICAALDALPRPRMLVTTPVHLRALLDAGTAVPPVDLVLCATAPLSTELAASAEEMLSAPLQEIYGSTETGQIAARRTTLGRHWTLLPDIALEQRGERFWASGGHVDPAMPLGDVLECEPDGRFLLQGRIGDMVNIAGKRNSLAHLNHQLLAIPGVVDGVFLMPEDETSDGVTRLVAFAVAPGLTLAALRAALRERIDPIFMPRPLILVEALPRNTTGKITRETIQALASTHLHQGGGHRRHSDGS